MVVLKHKSLTVPSEEYIARLLGDRWGARQRGLRGANGMCRSREVR